MNPQSFESFESFESFRQLFHSEGTCIAALFRARWPDGFSCSRCSHPHFYLTRTRRLPLFECRSCRHQTSIIAGTVMEGSSTSLARWFQAIFLLAQPGGISSSRLSKLIKVTYKTAWLISHKIRYAISKAEANDPLIDTVVMQPASYGYTNYYDARQPLVIGGSTDSDGQLYSLKIKQPDPKHVDNDSRRVNKFGIEAFKKEYIDAKATTILHASYKSHSSLNLVCRKMTNWLNHTFSGIGAKHLQAYLTEFSYHFNMINSRSPVFDSLLHWCVHTPALIYKDLIRSKRILPVPWIAWGTKAKWKGMHLSRWNVG